MMEDALYKRCNEGIKVCKEYLKEYPNGRYKDDVILLIEDSLFKRCHEGKKFCEEYLKELPEGLHKQEVCSLIDDFDWAGCKTIRDYRNYLSHHAFGKYTQQAKSFVEDYEKRDRSAWEACTNLKSYEKYLTDFPDGAYKGQAMSVVSSTKEKIKTFQIIGGIIITGLLVTLIVI